MDTLFCTFASTDSERARRDFRYSVFLRDVAGDLPLSDIPQIRPGWRVFLVLVGEWKIRVIALKGRGTFSVEIGRALGDVQSPLFAAGGLLFPGLAVIGRSRQVRPVVRHGMRAFHEDRQQVAFRQRVRAPQTLGNNEQFHTTGASSSENGESSNRPAPGCIDFLSLLRVPQVVA